MPQHRRTNRQTCSLNGPRGAPGERSWNLPRGTGEKTSILTGFWGSFGPPGVSLGDPGGTHFRPEPDGPQVALGGTWQARWSPGSSGSGGDFAGHWGQAGIIRDGSQMLRSWNLLWVQMVPGERWGRVLEFWGTALGKRSQFWGSLGSAQGPLGVPGGTHFRSGTFSKALKSSAWKQV